MTLAATFDDPRSPPSRGLAGPSPYLAAAAAVVAGLDRDHLPSSGPLTLPVLEDRDDRPVDLNRAFDGRPLILAFYAGGWSEPCTAALRELQSQRAALDAAGVGIAAVSPEAVGRIAETVARHGIRFLLAHDHASRFARSLGLAFRLPQAAKTELRAGGLKLSAWNGEASFELPLAATLLLSTDRIARLFVETEPRARRDVSAAVEAALAGP